MAMPIMICRFKKAIHDEQVFDELVRDTAYNRARGINVIIECDHRPTCKPMTKEEELQIKKRILIEVNKKFEESNLY